MKRNIILFILSFILVIYSLSFPAKVDFSNEIELKNVELGYPIKFIVQDWTGWSFNKWAKARNVEINELKVGALTPWETPTEILLPKFFLSIIIIWGILIILSNIFIKVFKTFKNKG